MPTSLTPQEREALAERFDSLAVDGPLSVLTRARFAELAALECRDGAVVSLYVDLSPQARHQDAWAIDVKTQAKKLLADLPAGADRDAVDHEVERMRRWLAEHASRAGRGAALFSCPSRGLWWQVSLPIPLPTRLRAGRRPYLRPLARVRDEHERFAVVILDKERARLFVIQLGHLEEAADLFAETPRHHDQGGWTQMIFQRRRDAHALWHAGAVAHATDLLMERVEARHLLVSGSAEVLAEYRSQLPPSVLKRWAGEFSLPVDASVGDVTRAVEPLIARTEAAAEREAIARINDAVPQGRGAWGLAGTLRGLEERRVMLLVVHDRYRAPGGECPGCGLLLVEGTARCPACGGEPAAVEDIVDAALERAVSQEAELELVRANDARRLLPPGEPIGALFRF
jgi:peptide subunit release factor 1 (eRF1)